MPQELRERLLAATTRTGRSLNAEIVERLEASIAEEESSSPRLGISGTVQIRFATFREGLMRRKRIRRAVAAVAVLVLVLATAVVAGRMTSSTSGQAARNFEKLAEGGTEQYAVGKNEDRSPDGTAEAQEAFWRAYPATVNEISFQATLNAQSAFEAIQARSAGSGSWQLIGPSSATYPGVLNVLNDGDQYIASGRTIAMAIDPSCTKQRCRLWIGAAGGGVWRTDKALQGANWEFLSGSFDTNAIGTLELDPNDPTGNTIYAGTGEPNASGDSAAGMGIYKSTNGGDTWTLLPGQRDPALELPGTRGQRHHDRAERRHHRRRRPRDPGLLGQHGRRDV